jgi:peptidoglycan hydrolase-like amidase
LPAPPKNQKGSSPEGFLVNGRKLVAPSLFIKSANPQGSVLFQSAVHRGVLEIRGADVVFSAISHLSMSDYLTGILNGEMANYWELEALKA